MEGKAARKAARKAQIPELLKKREEQANLPAEEVKQRKREQDKRDREAKREQDKRDREATREIVRKQAERMDFSPGPSVPSSPAFRTGSRGGKYTEAVTKEGRPYRRYF